MDMCSLARVRMCCSGVRVSYWNVVDIGLSYFIQDFVCFRAILLEPGLNRMGLILHKILNMPAVLKSQKKTFIVSIT